MKKIRYTLIIFTLILFFSACNSSKQIGDSINTGKSLYQTGNYENALQQFEEVIANYEKKNQQKECPVYGDAAYAAMRLGETDKAIGYFKKDQRSNFASADTYYQLAELYHVIDNLSKELDELEAYISKFPEGKELEKVKTRLFEVYIESENWEQANALWESLYEDDREKVVLLEGYFTANKALDNDSICNIITANVLGKDENNLLGLDWVAKKYFWQAENRYQDELKAYEKNKTNKQYKKLLKALDVVSSDFKTSLNYFKKIYVQDPKPATAKYIGNIYNRLDDKKKAKYYYRLAD